MHLELPLEQLVRRRGKGAQLSFATEAMQRMPRRSPIFSAWPKSSTALRAELQCTGWP